MGGEQALKTHHLKNKTQKTKKEKRRNEGRMEGRAKGKTIMQKKMTQ